LERIDSMELDTAMSYFEEHSHSLDDKLKEAWTVLRNHLCTLNTRTEDSKEEEMCDKCFYSGCILKLDKTVKGGCAEYQDGK